MNAALSLAQWTRLDEILAHRKRVEGDYLEVIQSFEGIKPPYRAPTSSRCTGFWHWCIWDALQP